MQPRGSTLLVACSFVPLLVKAVDYALLGSHVPLIVFCVFGGAAALGARTGPRAARRTIKLWALGLIVWAMARFGMSALFLTVDIGEALPVNQVAPWYYILSTGHLAVGIYLFRTSR